MEGVDFAAISPYVRMMRLKKVTTMLSGKWRDIDHVYTYIASGSAEFIIAGVRYQLHRAFFSTICRHALSGSNSL